VISANKESRIIMEFMKIKIKQTNTIAMLFCYRKKRSIACNVAIRKTIHAYLLLCGR